MNIRRIVVAAAVVLLAGCASTVKHESGVAPAALNATQRYSAVTITLTDEAKAKSVENIKFNADTLLSTVRRTMDAKGILMPDGAGKIPSVEIVVKDMRVRSSFTAVMFGFMAGNDSVTADVIVRDSAGAVMGKFEVSASYALGGLAGGQDESRLGWLYEKFAENTTLTLSGQYKN